MAKEICVSVCASVHMCIRVIWVLNYSLSYETE